MIIIMERDATAENIKAVTDLLNEHGFRVIVHEGDVHTVIDALGDKTTLSPNRIDALDGVMQIKFIREPFRLASRDRKSDDTIIEFSNGVKVGGANRPVFMVGPCSVEEDYEGLLKVAIAAKELGCTRFVCAGSIMEYEVEAAIHSQGSHPGMGYIYGMGKHIAHCMCKSVAANIGIDLLWPMITNAYGVGELSPRFVNTTLRKFINKEPLQFTAGTQNYDFVYVSDVARAFYKVALNGKPFCEYMIGSGDAKPLREFIIEMVGSCGPDCTPLFGDVPFTGTNMPLSTFGIADIKEDCGFEPEVSFAQGTKMTMEWLKTL